MKVDSSIGRVFSRELNPIVNLPAKHARLAGSYLGAMDISAIRTRNLKQLLSQIAERAPGLRQKDHALALDLSPSFLSQLVGGKKMGDDVARKIEAAQQLPMGWMDHAHWHSASGVRESEPPAYLSQPLRTDAETLAASTRLVRLACEALEVGFDPESAEDAQLVLLGCSYLSARNEQVVTADNVVDFTKMLRKRLHGEHSEGITSARRASSGTRG